MGQFRRHTEHAEHAERTGVFVHSIGYVIRHLLVCSTGSERTERTVQCLFIAHPEPKQMSLPREQGITPRLSVDELPVVDFDGLVAKKIHRTMRGHLAVVQANEITMSKLLATDMRDARTSGHTLGKVHMQAR